MVDGDKKYMEEVLSEAENNMFVNIVSFLWQYIEQ